MSATTLTEVQNQVQTFWANLFTKELRAKLLLGSLLGKDYEGEIKQLGNKVRVSQINKPLGQTRTAGVDADVFSTSQLSMSYVDVTADKRFVAAFEFQDLVELQSQIGAEQSSIREALMYAVEEQVNDYLYGLVSPSTSSPDHVLESTASMTSSVIRNVRKLAAQANWMKEKGWWFLNDPGYYSDILGEQTLVSSDYVADAPTVGGQVINQRFGFNILEDTSMPLATASNKYALAFHPDFMHFCIQKEAKFELSSLHSQKKFGYVLSVDLIGGAALGVDGDLKHIVVKSTA